MLRGYPAAAYHSRSTETKPSLGVSKSLRKDLGGFQKSAASLVIRSVLVSLLFILQSPNIGFNNFTLMITLPVAAKEQRSNETSDTLHLGCSYHLHSSHRFLSICGAVMLKNKKIKIKKEQCMMK